MSRIRERTFGIAAGGSGVDWTGYTHTQTSSWPASDEWMDDSISSKPPWIVPHHCKHLRRSVTPSRASGTFPGKLGKSNTLSNWVYDLQNTGYSVTIPPWDLVGLITKALASINPAKPIVDLPLFIWELKDLPIILSRIRPGDMIPGASIAWKFGWEPLIDDLRKLLNFVELTEQRKSQLEKMATTKRIEISLGGDGSNWTSPSVSRFSFGGGWLDYRHRYSYSREYSAVGKMKLAHGLPGGNTAPLFGFHQAMGSGGTISTVWNALPWSWLVDYLSNVGDYMLAYSGNTQFDLDHICIMQNATGSTETEHVNMYKISEDILNPGSVESEFFQRRVVYDPKPGISFQPFLSGGQVANLASLFLSKHKSSIVAW